MHGIKITGIFAAREKKIATDIDSAEMLVKKQNAWHKTQDELAGARTRGSLKSLMGPRKLVKLKNQKSLQKHHDEAKRLKEKANQDIAQSRVEALAGVKGEVADLTVPLGGKKL